MKLSGRELQIPIIQGGMGIGVSSSGLAGTVAACGAMGVISSVNIGYTEDDFEENTIQANLRALKKHIRKAKEIAAGKGLVAVNIMTAVTHYEETCRAAVEAGADAIISGAGLPLKLPEFTKETRTMCAPIVSGARAARLLLRKFDKLYGIIPDFFVLEGYKAGGHLGFDKQELIEGSARENEQILPEVIDELVEYEKKYDRKIPVFVAGGVYDGADMSRVMKLGASGVQIATRFIATDECDADIGMKQMIVDSTKDDVKIIQSPVGMPARAVDSPLLRRLDNGEKFPPVKCNNCLEACPKGNKTPYCISRALIAAVKGDKENGLFFSGENAYRINKIVSVKEVINEIISEWRSLS